MQLNCMLLYVGEYQPQNMKESMKVFNAWFVHALGLTMYFPCYTAK